MKEYLPYLDGWRGIAILLVLGGHFFRLPAARTGVDVFFVLSGLLMSRVLFEARTPLGTFYQRRLARILPTFFLFLGVVAIVAAVELPRFPVGQFVFNASFLQRYMPEGMARNLRLPIVHLWSLNVEEHSYVLLSLIALFTRQPRFARIALTVATLACVGAYAVHGLLGTDGTFRTECAAFGLLASAALRLWLKDSGKARPLLAGACLGIVISIAVSRKLGGSVVIDYLVKPFCLALMVNTLHAAPGWVHRALSAAWLRWFGVCSFSIYLWQQPFSEWVLDGTLHPTVALLGALAVGAASFYFFEDPTRRAIRNWRPRARRAVVAAE